MPNNNLGKKFEKNFKEAAKKEGIFFYRIPDSTQSFGGGNSSFTHDSLADAFAFYNRILFALELKSTKYKSITIERENTKENSHKMIKKNQIKNLIECQSYNDIEGCFIFNFRTQEGDEILDEHTYIININNFSNFLEQTDKMSISEKEVIEFGGVEIESVKKKKWFTYKIQDGLYNYLEQRKVSDGNG